MRIDFPDPKTHEFADWVLVGEFYYNSSDIIGFGGDLTVENLISAYRRGIFPWHIEGMPLPWFCPQKRAVLEFADLHIPKSLQKIQKNSSLTFTIDHCFSDVIKNCSGSIRQNEAGTWITPEFIAAYSELHAMGLAHSVEAWEGSELVGGLYGVDIGGLFCGESMFFKKSNASKLALLYLVGHLKDKGATWLDVQVMTPHFEAFGAKDIPRSDFLVKLEHTLAQKLRLF
jgi:leucyl/phenylalanyl-tRNA---protein transferase